MSHDADPSIQDSLSFSRRSKGARGNRFTMGKFILNNLPFKPKVMKDIYKFIGHDPQTTFVTLTHEKAKKIQICYANYNNRRGAQLVYGKVGAFKEAGVEIGDQLIRYFSTSN